jgi:hypothetical protein
MTMLSPPPAHRWKPRNDRVFHVLKHDDPALVDVGGRPPHEPTVKSRATVKAMSAYGIPHVQIARVLDIHEQTLRLHYRDELDLGVIEANSKIAETLFNQGVRDGNTAALIWWTKSRMGWKETQRVETEDVGTKEARDAAHRAALEADG